MSRLLLAIVCPSTCLAQWPSPKTAMNACPHGVCEKSWQRRISAARMPAERSSSVLGWSAARPAWVLAQLIRQRIARSCTAGGAAGAAWPRHTLGGARAPALVVVPAGAPESARVANATPRRDMAS